MPDSRSAPRIRVKFTAICERDGKGTECEIIDLSPQGIGIRVNILLVPGDIALIKIGEHHMPAKVVRASGNLFGLWFRDLTGDQLEYIKWLCRKNGNSDTSDPDQKMVSTGTKVYILRAGSEKEMGILGLFLTALKKNCKGFISSENLPNGVCQVEINDSPSSVSSFETLLLLWKAGNLLVNK